jgi:MGT family glycosyltransferase
MTDRTLTVLFMPESAYRPTNQCIGLGDVLRRRGHRVVFAAEASWKGKLTALGFEEDLVDLSPPAEQSEEVDAGKFWKDFIRDTAPEFRKPTIDQLEGFIRPTWEALIDGAKFCEPQLREILQRVQPDVIVEDNVVAFPALLTARAPYVRILSCNPLEASGPDIPPVFSGYPQDDRSGWQAFGAEYRRSHQSVWQDFNDWVFAQGAPALPELQFIHTSEFANLYVYPAELDYVERRPLDATWHRLESSVRETDEAYELPEVVRGLPEGSGRIYLSLGSLGSADVKLMRRLIEVLGRTPHRFIVSMGPQHAELKLADNMVGAELLPQTKVIPQVDLVITHGGNNTTTESMHFGKPMIVLPIFWDQHDNAQRVAERGFGMRLDTYRFSDDQLTGAVQQLLGDHALREKMAAIGDRIRATEPLQRGADVIESVARSNAARSA